MGALGVRDDFGSAFLLGNNMHALVETLRPDQQKINKKTLVAIVT
jgi:hypothetical protein